MFVPSFDDVEPLVEDGSWLRGDDGEGGPRPAEYVELGSELLPGGNEGERPGGATVMGDGKSKRFVQSPRGVMGDGRVFGKDVLWPSECDDTGEASSPGR